MFILRFLWAVLTSRFLWTLIGLLLVSALVWIFGPIVAIGDSTPFADEIVRLAIIAGLVVLWLVWVIVRQRRAIKANRLFVAEIAAPAEKPLTAGEESVRAIGSRFAEVMGELKRRKLGSRKFLRDMPWYVIIGPPATGKTTALRQSGLNFPIDLTDDLHGVGGTRNCDWFFSEHAVLIDTAGRYVEQESRPDADAAEWLGFLDLLKKHRGRRALNGVIVALGVDALSEGDAAIRAHGKKIRKRLMELRDRLGIRLPVYLMLTKADLIKGFEAFFGDLSTQAREEVWGATFAAGERVDAGTVARELGLIAGQLERRLVARLENEENLRQRAETFRFPAQVESLAEPIRILFDSIFGENRYEESAWPRGIYFTSATQEGAPIDRLTAALSSSFGLPAVRMPVQQRVEKRSFFLKDLLAEVIFKEAGLGTFDAQAERKRLWIWRGAAAASVLALALLVTLSTLSYLDNRQAVAAQAAQFESLREPLTPLAAMKAPVDAPDIDLGIAAASEVQGARTAPPSGVQDLLGPSASAEMLQAQDDAYDRTLRNVLEPRMVALLEAAMWRQIRDPEFQLGALKAYRMMTGLSQMDPDFVGEWWQKELPKAAPVKPFPNDEATRHQLDAIERMAVDDSYTAPDQVLIAQSLKSICSISLPARAYKSLLADPEVAALKEWAPANFAGPNGAKVLSRRSGKTLRVGIPGAFTYAGFHDVVLNRLEDVAAQAALDRNVFAGGCSENADTSLDALSGDILKLYYEDFVSQWDSLLRDIRLTPLTDLNVASQNLKDLSSADSAMKRLVVAAVRETELTRDDEGGEGDDKAQNKATSKILSKLGKLGKLASTGIKLIPRTGDGTQVDLAGTTVAEHFKPLKSAIAEVDGVPPLLDATVAALTALSNVLQTVTASPDPQDAIKRQGGLAELIGAVGTQAQTLPDPLDDWLAGIAGDASGLTEKAVTSELNAIWRADILPFCQAALSKRYPFDADSAIDVNIRDFQRLFGPGAMIDGFINDHLINYIDTATTPWKWRPDFKLDPAPLAAFEQARHIRDDLFADGSGPTMTFTLEPKDLSPNAARVALNLDGQALTYFNNATRPQPMTWPGKDGTGVITLTFEPLDGSPEVTTTETGSWAWLRMLRTGGLSNSGLPEQFKMRLGTGSYFADFELRANSVENPYNLKMFAKFSCPQNI